MANLMTKTQYDNIKNETYTIFKFNKDGERVAVVTTTFYGVVAELVESTRGSLTIFAINEKELTLEDREIIRSSKNIEDYGSILQRERKVY